MNLKQIQAFVWVATLGSFRKTAEKLFTTQPAISSRIAALEESLGVKLFERGTGKVALTSKGNELLPLAEQFLFLAERFKERANASVSLSGLVRIGVSETIVQMWLPEFLNRLHLTLPLVDVELTVDITPNLRSDLLDRSYDLAFLLGPIAEHTIANHVLSTFPLDWVVSPSLSFQQDEADLVTLSQWPIVTYAKNTQPYSEIRARFRSEGPDPVRIFSSTSLAACKRMTLDGIGVGTLPLQYIRAELEDGQLKGVRSSWKPSDLVFTASYPREPYNRLAERVSALAVDVAQDFNRFR